MQNRKGLERVDDDLIKVSGSLDVTTVSKYKDEGIELIEKANEPVMDLSEITVAGSAVIALLIAWERHAAKRGKHIKYVHAPDNLVDIARACGVQDIIVLNES